MNQELMRLLIAVSEQLTASMVLFLRSGVWAVIAVAVMYLMPETRSLESVLAAWTVGGVCAFILAIIKLSRMRIGGWAARIDWSWIKKGVQIALPLLVATLAIRAVYTLDRYWLESLAGLEVLGAYVLFMGLASAMMAFLDAGVFAFSYPSLIRAFQQGNHEEFKQGQKRLLVQTLLMSCVFAGVALTVLDPLLAWLDKPLYIEQKGLFPWILLSTFLYAVGMVPHYALYAQSLDRPIIHSHIASLVIFIVTTWQFSHFWPVQAVPMGLCAAFLIILVWKLYAYCKHTPRLFRLTNP